MPNPAPKTTPRERLAKMLKSGSTIREVSYFREQCRDVYRLGGLKGLDCWIEARRDFDLIQGKALLRAADQLQALIFAVIESAMIKPEPKGSGMTWQERLAQINQREKQNRSHVPRVGCYVTRRPLTCAERMTAAYEKLQRDVP